MSGEVDTLEKIGSHQHARLRGACWGDWEVGKGNECGCLLCCRHCHLLLFGVCCDAAAKWVGTPQSRNIPHVLPAVHILLTR